MCNTVHRNDKWLEHCKKKHAYKLKNNIHIKYKITEMKEGNGPWTPYELSGNPTFSIEPSGSSKETILSNPQPSTSAQLSSSTEERYGNVLIIKNGLILAIRFDKQGNSNNYLKRH